MLLRLSIDYLIFFYDFSDTIISLIGCYFETVRVYRMCPYRADVYASLPSSEGSKLWRFKIIAAHEGPPWQKELPGGCVPSEGKLFERLILDKNRAFSSFTKALYAVDGILAGIASGSAENSL